MMICKDKLYSTTLRGILLVCTSLTIFGIYRSTLIPDQQLLTIPLPISYLLDAKNPTKPVCSLSVIKEYMLDKGYFPTNGSWLTRTLHYPSCQYRVDTCILQSPSQAQNSLKKYMRIKRPKRITVIGDSNGRRHFDALSRLVRKIGYSCSVLKKEKNGYQPTVQYYTQGTGMAEEALVLRNRTCHSCNSQLNICLNMETKHQLMVEYVSMMLFTPGILPNRTYCQNKHHISQPVCSVKTQQEFLFSVYMKKQFPDLMLMFSAFGHAIGENQSVENVKQFIADVLDLLDQNAPDTSTIVWYPTSSTKPQQDSTYSDKMDRNNDKMDKNDDKMDKYNDKMNKNNDKMNRNNDKMTFTEMNEKTLEMNHALFGSLLAKIKSGDKKTFAFLDLFDMAMKIQIHWGMDHVHFIGDFYDTVIAYTMQLLAQDLV